MSNSAPFSWYSDRVVKLVFAFGAVYFAFTTGYSLLHYTEKFMVDGYALVFYIANWEWFPPPAQREIVYLQQALPVLFAIMGLKIKWVMIGYILNVYLLYFVLFVVTALVLKDPFASLLLLLVHYKGTPYNYFLFVEELLPGACMVIVFLSLFRNLSWIPYRKVAYMAGIFLLFFIVRSHPLAMVCLAGGMAVLFFADRPLFTEHRKLVAVLSIAAVVLIAAKLLFLNSYDSSYAGHIKSPLASVLQLFTYDHITEVFFYLFYMRKIFTTVFVITISYLLFKEKYKLIVAISLITGGCIVLFNMAVVTTDFKAWGLDQTSYDRWSLPVRFIVFTAFCFMVVPAIKSYQAFRGAGIIAVVYFFMGFIQIAELQETSQAYISQTNKIIERCRDAGVSKAIINRGELDSSIPIHHNCYEDIMVISSFQSPDSTIQVVYVDDETSLSIGALENDELLLNEKDQPYSHDEINAGYFHLQEEPYVFVSMTAQTEIP